MHQGAIDVYLAGSEDLPMSFQDGDAGSVQQPAVDAVESVDLPVLVGPEGIPGQCAHTGVGIPVIAGKGRDRRKAGGIRKHFFRHTADIDASSAKETRLDNRHAGAELRSDSGCTHATGAGAYYDQIKFCLRHCYFPGYDRSGYWCRCASD